MLVPFGERIDELALVVSKNRFDGLVGVSLGDAVRTTQAKAKYVSQRKDIK